MRSAGSTCGRTSSGKLPKHRRRWLPRPQLPQFKKQLDQSEDAYNRYRNQQGTVALDEEAKLILNRSVDLQSKLLEAQQKRRELVARFTAEHPTVKTLDEQIDAWNREISSLNARVKACPACSRTPFAWSAM